MKKKTKKKKVPKKKKETATDKEIQQIYKKLHPFWQNFPEVKAAMEGKLFDEDY